MFSHLVNIFHLSIGILAVSKVNIKSTADMNENIKFTKDSVYGAYAADDTGVLVGFTRGYTDIPYAIVRLDTNKYVMAPLEDIEYVPTEE